MLKGSAFPVEAGLRDITTGTFELIKGVRAYEDTNVTIQPKNGGDAFPAVIHAGEDAEILNCESLTVNSGLCSLTRRTQA